jgi:UDP-3-O-[3-hydroxymyristoyl] glucosamine N-acyltransferase
MLLSEVTIIPPGQIVRDGRFRSIGFVDHLAEELLVALHESRFLDHLHKPNISCVITTEGLADRVPERLGLVIDSDPKRAFYDLHDYLLHAGFYGPSIPSVIAATARVHPRSYVAPMDINIGPEVIIEPNATILGRVRIDAGAVIRAGSVIGAEGFGVRKSGGHQVHLPHAGSVHIAAGAQILANCTIVRATFGGATIIGEETVINAQSYIAHNVSIGARCLIAAGAVIAGNAKVGDEVWIGPGAVISNSVSVGDRAAVSLGAVVVRDVAPGERVSGHFAIAHRKFLSFLAKSRSDVGGR